MSRRQDVIRVGDKVKIITPKIFIRCGYPMTTENACNAIDAMHGDSLQEFLKSIGFGVGFRKVPVHYSPGERMASRVYRKIRDALAFEYLHLKGFGGSERRIYTQYVKEYKNQLVTICRKFVKKTGTYYPPCGPSLPNYDDYDPGGLSGEKTHIILEFMEWPNIMNADYRDQLRPLIEKQHVKKIHSPHVYKEKGK